MRWLWGSEYLCVCFVVLAVFVQSRGWKHNSIASSIPRFKPSLLLPVCGCYMVYWYNPPCGFVCDIVSEKKKKHISPSCQSILSERHVGVQGTSVEACQTSSNQMERFPLSHRSDASREREMHGGVVQSEPTPKWGGAARTGSRESHAEHALLFATAFWPAGHMSPLHPFGWGRLKEEGFRRRSSARTAEVGFFSSPVENLRFYYWPWQPLRFGCNGKLSIFIGLKGFRMDGFYI